ncbi:hypothetical protein KIS4809_4352 [Bacillus sp. ZZV12-4809]|nr:hypothetical protein KIS4809_4352 [Bacillus sp. ZZV12-4809]
MEKEFCLHVYLKRRDCAGLFAADFLTFLNTEFGDKFRNLLSLSFFYPAQEITQHLFGLI